VRESEEWVIGVYVGLRAGSKLLRMSLVLCKRVFSLLHEAVSGCMRGLLGALWAPMEGGGGSPVSPETVFATGWRGNYQEGGHVWTVSNKA